MAGKKKQTVADLAELATHRVFNNSGFTETEGSEFFKTPLSELIKADELDEAEYRTLNREEIQRLRSETIALFLRHLIGDPGRSPDLLQIGTTVAVCAWESEAAPFDKMTQGQIAELKEQGRAAICERLKKTLGENGGHRKTKRGKSGAVKKKLANSATGNRNRSTAKANQILKQTY